MYYPIPSPENPGSPNQRFLPLYPNIPSDDYPMILPFLERLSEPQAKDFLRMYSETRLDAQTYILLALMGFLGLFGVQRYYIGDWGMGIAQTLTCGFLFIGAIYDMATGKEKIRQLNIEKARTIFSNYGDPFDVEVF